MIDGRYVCTARSSGAVVWQRASAEPVASVHVQLGSSDVSCLRSVEVDLDMVDDDDEDRAMDLAMSIHGESDDGHEVEEALRRLEERVDELARILDVSWPL